MLTVEMSMSCKRRNSACDRRSFKDDNDTSVLVKNQEATDAPGIRRFRVDPRKIKEKYDDIPSVEKIEEGLTQLLLALNDPNLTEEEK